MDSISELTVRINEFRDARDWKQFHNPKDMAISISIEAAELLSVPNTLGIIERLWLMKWLMWPSTFLNWLI